MTPLLLSKEDWRATQRFQPGTSACVGDRRKELFDDGSNNRSLFSLQPGSGGSANGDADVIGPRKVTPRNVARQPFAEWLEKDTDGLIGLAGVGLGARRKSLADMLQEGVGQLSSELGHLSHSWPSSRNAFDDVLDPIGVPDPSLTQLHSRIESLDGLHSGAASPGMLSLGSSISQTYASAVGSSLSRSTTPEASLIGRPTACNLPLGGRGAVPDKNNVVSANKFNGVSSGMDTCADISDGFSGLSISRNELVDENNRLVSN